MNITPEIAHREMYWNINSPYKFLIYPLVLISLGIFAYGVYKKFQFIKDGKPDPDRFKDLWKRVKMFLWEIPFQTKVLKEKKGGIIHVMIFWSFLLLMAVTAVVFVDVDFGVPIYNGALYLFLTIMADLAGLALFAGLAAAAVRRYAVKPDQLDNKWDDAFVLAVLGVSVITGFVLEGMRIHYTNDPWAIWSPVGYAVSFVVGGLSENAVMRTYQTFWWLHCAAMFVFIAALPYTKLFHIVTLPTNVFFTSLKPKGSLERVDIEALMNDEAAAENFNVGVSEVKDLTWKNRLDYEACIRCGRCEEVCPSVQNGKPLSPKRLIQDLKTFALANANGNNGNGAGQPQAAEGAEVAEAEPKLIVGGAFDSETIWECRTCRACMEVCPAHIEHVPQMMELRRAEVMMRGQLPMDANIALKTLERGGNPFGPQEERSNWIRENQIPVIPPGGECEALFWIGCCTTYDLMKQKVAYHVLKIMMEGGISVGVLGEDENCCGDPARLLADENLFQTIVKDQIAKIKSRKFKYLVTHCPHCFNNFKNEYPQFGGDFEVVHHTELIHRLIKEGRIKLELPVDKKVTFHDPCYLGRYNDVYDQPREILKSIKGVEVVEMEHNKELSQCCGGGGGHYWMDIPTGERINVTRVNEATAAKADTIAVGCVFCLQMLNDAIKILDVEDKMEVVDISELVVASMGKIAEAKKMVECIEEEAAA